MIDNDVAHSCGRFSGVLRNLHVRQSRDFPMNEEVRNEDVRTDTSQARIERIVRRLEEDIVLGRLKPRERLLEEELATLFDAKRHVVRRALLELESMGMITHQPNRGAAVRDFTPTEVEQIYSVREMLEREAALLMPLPASPETLATLKGIHARHSAAVEQRDARTVFRENLAFHRVLFAACGNPYLAEMIELLAYRSHGIRFYSISDRELLMKMRDEHGEMIACMERGDRDRLVELVSGHIRPSKDAYFRLAHLSGSAF
jgi:DNA-binding GntR family transcriptional regulator